jgi:hypothetical protein
MNVKRTGSLSVQPCHAPFCVVQQGSKCREEEGVQILIIMCHADCRMYVAGRTTGQVGSAIRP